MTRSTTKTKKATRRGPSAQAAQERDTKIAALHAQITEGVEALVDSGAWKAMLDTAARFHTYSGGGVGIFESRECCPDGVFDEPRDVDDHRRSGRARHMRSAI